MARKFYTADLHYDHPRIIKLSNRPFPNLNEMQQAIVSNWNRKVYKGDDVYILGDVCFRAGEYSKLLELLNGNIHIIPGNHDDKAIKKLQKDYTISNVTYHRDILNIKDNGRKVVLCHYPIHEWDGYYNGAIHVHGHTHSNIGISFREGAYDAGVDARNFEPVTLDEMINWS